MTIVSTHSIPVVRGTHGAQLWQFSGIISPALIISFLGHDPRSRKWKDLAPRLRALYQKTQQTTAPARVKSLIHFIESRMMNPTGVASALPAITVVVENPVKFSAIDPTFPDVGTLSINLASVRIAADGLARLTALLDMIDAGIAPSALPNVGVTIIAPQARNLLDADFQQIFFDLNVMRKNVTASAAGSKDSSNIYGNIGKRLHSLSVFKNVPDTNRGMNEDRAFRLVRGALEGIRGDVNRNQMIAIPNIKHEHADAALKSLGIFWDRIADQVGATDFENPERTVLFRSPMLNAIGLVLFNRARGDLANMRQVDIEAIADAICKIDLSPTHAQWQGILFSGTRSLPTSVATELTTFVSEEVTELLS